MLSRPKRCTQAHMRGSGTCTFINMSKATKSSVLPAPALFVPVRHWSQPVLLYEWFLSNNRWNKNVANIFEAFTGKYLLNLKKARQEGLRFRCCTLNVCVCVCVCVCACVSMFPFWFGINVSTKRQQLLLQVNMEGEFPVYLRACLYVRPM